MLCMDYIHIYDCINVWTVIYLNFLKFDSNFVLLLIIITIRDKHLLKILAFEGKMLYVITILIHYIIYIILYKNFVLYIFLSKYDLIVKINKYGIIKKRNNCIYFFFLCKKCNYISFRVRQTETVRDKLSRGATIVDSLGNDFHPFPLPRAKATFSKPSIFATDCTRMPTASVAWKSSTSFYLHDKYATFYAHYFAPPPSARESCPNLRSIPDASPRHPACLLVAFLTPSSDTYVQRGCISPCSSFATRRPAAPPPSGLSQHHHLLRHVLQPLPVLLSRASVRPATATPYTAHLF